MRLPGACGGNSGCPGGLLSGLTEAVNNFLSQPPAERFAMIMESVFQALAAQGVRGAVVGALLFLVCGRLRTAAARVLVLAARLEAGTLRLRPPREWRPSPRRPDPPASAQAPKLRLPRGFGWLARRVQTARFGRSQLAHLLAQPDMAALIEAAPPIGRQIRPICRMLGVRPPPGLFPPRRRRQPTPQGAASPSPRPSPASGRGSRNNALLLPLPLAGLGCEADQGRGEGGSSRATIRPPPSQTAKKPP